MDKRIGILHLSDIHTSLKSSMTIQRLVDLLKTDIKNLTETQNIEIKIICITGDLINSGDNADVEIDIALEVFLQPLMEFLHLDERSVFIVAGNHEVKQSNVVPYVETGLESTLKSESNIENFIRNLDQGSLKRIAYFDRDFTSMFGEKIVLESPLTRVYMIAIDDFSVGISCVNSSWRSTGAGNSEKRKMVVGRKQIIDSYEKIQTADIKICMMHHPFDWLVDDDKTAIEKCINQYDIVLTGHIHESDTKVYTTYNGQTLFNTCGKFDNSSDIYNGYALLAINPYNKDCDVILRQYMDYPRNCFDAALSVIQGGIFPSTLGKKDDRLALAYNVVHAIEAKFLDFANSYFVSNVAAGKVLKNFDESFIQPEFSKYSEYEKETKIDSDMDAEEEVISLDSICNGTKNILILGKKEIGKTTLLHYLVKHYLSNFNTLKTVPIIINTIYVDYPGKNVITQAAHKFITKYCDASDSYSLSDIEALLNAGLCTVMFDHFETVSEPQLKKINDFLTNYPKNRFVFSENEDVGARCLREIEVVPACEYSVAHICSLTKNQIRTIATQSKLTDDCSSVVDRIMLCFKRTTLPKTPFVLSLILSICDMSDFSPINEAVIMEQFMEFLLEKTSPLEAYSTTFDFRIKEDFLIYLVSYMDDHNKFYLANEEFERLLLNYHTNIGFAVKETGFDTLFFNKGVLIRTELIVTFRYNCMVEYYLAKKAEQSPDFLKHILNDENYLNYSDALLYYTGLNRKSIEIVSVLQSKLHHSFEELSNFIAELKDYNIGVNIALPKDTFSQKLSQSKLSQVQSDKIQDTRDISEDKLPEHLDKHLTHGDMDTYIQTLLIYGNCLKNLELIPKDEKEQIYRDYIFGLCIMLGILKRNTEDFFKNEVSDMEQLPEKYSKEDIDKIKAMAQDILKITLPIAIQNIAVENIGTPKLKSVIGEAISSGNCNEFWQFFSVFLYSDLRLPGLQSVLKKYVSEAKDKSVLKIIFFKLMYYYCFRYFSSSLDSFLESMLADINIRLNDGNKYRKSQIIQTIKEQKQSLKP